MQVAEVTFTGALVPRQQERAEREVAQRVAAETGRYVEVMSGMTSRVPGGFRVTVVMGKEQR